MPRMEYLSPSSLRKAAPAVQKLPDPGTLIDTSVFLKAIAKFDYRPVLAVQGTPHRDTGKKVARGRHLIVSADPKGSALVLLNSHTILRSAWLGIGFARSVKDHVQFLIGAAMPISRWKGFEPPLMALMAYRGSLQAVKKGFEEWTPSSEVQATLAASVAKNAYLHRACRAEELDPGAVPAWEGMLEMFDKLRAGNMVAAKGKYKVKPIRGPDALFHAANAVFNAGLTLMPVKHYGGVELKFPTHDA